MLRLLLMLVGACLQPLLLDWLGLTAPPCHTTDATHSSTPALESDGTCSCKLCWHGRAQVYDPSVSPYSLMYLDPGSEPVSTRRLLLSCKAPHVRTTDRCMGANRGHLTPVKCMQWLRATHALR